MPSVLAALALAGTAQAAVVSFATVTTQVTSTITPAVFQTTPEVFNGPTTSGEAPMLAETNPAPVFGTKTVSYIPPSPLETQEPIKGAKKGDNIFHLMGNLSPYHPSPGFGIDEYPLPNGTKVEWLNTIHRHGARYPTDPIALGAAIAEAQASGAKFSGDLTFLNTWSYQEGVDILSPSGRQELFDSGVAHYYEYANLFNPNATNKLVIRTTTEERMRQSAENFAAGFFGLQYPDYVNIEFIIDETGYNNSLAGYNACPNNNNYETTAGSNASTHWIDIYTNSTVGRLQSMTKGFTWNSSLIDDAQELCAYETVNLGYSAWCDLFTYQEWLDFEQSIDIDFYGTYGFGSPTGRAVGIGYVEEVLARIEGHLLTTAAGSANITYDNMTSTFPLNQTLNFDFSHDVNIFAVATAFGLTQFRAEPSNSTYNPKSVNVADIVPFGGRIDITIIDAPSPISASRSNSTANSTSTAPPPYTSGGPTKYISFKINQRTLPLYESYSACPKRDDGWCELTTWLDTQKNALAESNYEFACYGNYTVPYYGQLSNGTIFSS